MTPIRNDVHGNTSNTQPDQNQNKTQQVGMNMLGAILQNAGAPKNPQEAMALHSIRSAPVDKSDNKSGL